VPPDADKPRCSATTRKGQPCKANPVLGTDRCMAHQDEEAKQSVGFGGAQEGAGRPRRPRATEVLLQRIEENIDFVIGPMFEALVAERGLALQVKGGGMEVGYVPDHETRLRAARDLLDRAYGRPRQAVEVTGEDGGPIQTSGIDLSGLSAEELRALRELLGKAGA
jgi:hypothetical protein